MGSEKKVVTIDGNEAAAYIAYRLSEVIAIYPITPSSPMGELSDSWATSSTKNIWGTIPSVAEMQSEGGAAGAVHGALQAGSLTTTFTASQGLLLMIPNMYKIAGELTPAVFHVAARSIATHALSIFGDHSDVMACRQTGFSLLSSGSVQEVMDLALVAHMCTLESRVPFLHFFDGFRTSHELMKVELIPEEIIKEAIDDNLVFACRDRALTPDRATVRGTAQNPDVFFQAREASNVFYEALPDIVQRAMDKVGALVGRHYNLFDYEGHPEATRVIVIMGSGGDAVHETVDYLNKHGSDEKVRVLKVRLYRPFDTKRFLEKIPSTVKSIAVLDRTKEPGSLGEPLYQDIVTAYAESSRESMPTIIGGRYGLSSKEFTPSMIKGVFDELKKEEPKNHFTIGIYDDVTNTSLDYDPDFSTEPENVFRGVFIGLGSDGTVGANKNSIKIIGEETNNYTQGYFVYDSKKAGSVTKSHLRFGPEPIRSSYLVNKANFVACHQFQFIEKFDVLAEATKGATFLLNSPYSATEIWDNLPKPLQKSIIEKDINFYVIDAYNVAKLAKMGVRINTIMQTCFFAIAGILEKEEAIKEIKKAIKKTFGKYGEQVVNQNYDAVDRALDHLQKVKVPSSVSSKIDMPPVVPEEAPDFVKDFTASIIEGRGDMIPVSKMPVDGVFPSGTTQWEKRNITKSIPVWDPEICTQCSKCSFVCPHGVIRIKIYNSDTLKDAPSTFKSIKPKGRWPENSSYTIQVAPEDCTGCALCVDVCPAKNKTDSSLRAINMSPQLPIRKEEKKNWDFFLNIPDYDRKALKVETLKDSQLLRPLFEFSGACAGCGETPYLKLISQLYGDRMYIANATGCSSIYGGNLPTTPWAVDENGRGPAWANSLFEDNAEFGMGISLSVEKKEKQAREYVKKLSSELGDELVDGLVLSSQRTESEISEQRARIELLKEKLSSSKKEEARHLLSLADFLVRKSIWIVGGDGWAYDIGFGGLDHVLASGRDVNILILDTEVYSNTGGQMSKSTPLGAVAKFASAGKSSPKKDMGLLAMGYGNIYVASIASGANDTQTIRAITEAESYNGPSLIIAYSHCIAHGYSMTQGVQHQKLAVESGYWPLYRYNPSNLEKGKNPLKIDSRPPKVDLSEYMATETRFKMLFKSNPERAKELEARAKEHSKRTYEHYKNLAAIDYSLVNEGK